uniref:Odorant binding protein 4 n=1 Tax=Laodelphax striatellus TaxID=195883 RepID=A0A096W1J5_LAOST|nr:odorant binding protein 4 [Laodelphax striatellus]
MKSLIVCVVVSCLLVANTKADEATSSKPSSSPNAADALIASTTLSPASNETDAARAAIKEQLAKLTESCKTSSQANSDEAKIIGTESVPKTEGEKCFLQCVYTGLGIVKNEQFSVEGAKLLAQKRFGSFPEELEKANQLIETCSKEAVKKDSKDKCPMGFLIRQCFVKNGQKINFFPKA